MGDLDAKDLQQSVVQEALAFNGWFYLFFDIQGKQNETCAIMKSKKIKFKVFIDG